MSTYRHGRYSGFIRPIAYTIDFAILLGLAGVYFFRDMELLFIAVYLVPVWIAISLATKFYEVYRYTREVTIIALILRQFVLFTLILYATSGVLKSLELDPVIIIQYSFAVSLLISIFKFAVYYLLQRYRIEFGGNFRSTVIIGRSKNTRALETFFKNNPEYGYILRESFEIKKSGLEELEACFHYIRDEHIDEIYCSIAALSNAQINHIINFADNNLKKVKFVPDNKEIYSRKLSYQYYDYLPILVMRDIPLEIPFNKYVKRGFDLIFSAFVIVFILSWLTPLVALFIRLESRGPIFFKQARNGMNYEEFYCYKFRSMKPNVRAHLHQATRDDVRITKVGAFLRKTSIDELPQFFNVLFGDMSVVGPRPHMVSHTNKYARNVDKFMVRHFVKPGITGLAQVRGYRGEVERDKDIIGRVKYDIFYIENWSLLLDIRIIILTFINVIRGEDKAY